MPLSRFEGIGALPDSSGATFTVWAPEKHSVDVVFEDGRRESLQIDDGGIFHAHVDGISCGDRYRFSVDGSEPIPDPASRFQPDGVHGASEVIDLESFVWTDQEWRGKALDEMVIYEIHVGTFTPEGTYDALRSRLPYLRKLGINAIELMPVADFPGRWNWGYDHAALYAPSRAYGRPDDLKQLVDEAHRLGIAVLLDVIYNHFGPDGSYAPAYAPFFSRKHRTPWGPAINLDGKHSEGVRSFLIRNAVYWLEEFHFDGLRLDATQTLIDESDPHFLKDLVDAVSRIPTGPERLLIAEDSRNLNDLLRTRESGGYGIDAVWTDDFHHLIRNRTAGDRDGYFADFSDARIADIAATINRGWFYIGQPGRNNRPRGTDPHGLRSEQFVYYIQNHDQIGNRPRGNRMTDDISLPLYRALSSLLLLLPQTPLLFMGQEWAASSPFLFFTDHYQKLGRAVREGRRREFHSFRNFAGTVPDPQAEATFERSKLNWDEQNEMPHSGIRKLYQDLLRMRHQTSGPVHATERSESVLEIRRQDHVLLIAFDGGAEAPLSFHREILWHSEEDHYAVNPAPPSVTGQTIHFSIPSAVLLGRIPD